MADLNNNGVFGGVEFNNNSNGTENTSYFDGMNVGGNNNQGVYGKFDTIPQQKAITKQGLWSKIKAFLFQEIDLNAKIQVELTPYQQKVEDEINEFLHQEVSFKSIANLFKGKK